MEFDCNLCIYNAMPVYLLPGVKFVLNIKDHNGNKFFLKLYCVILDKLSVFTTFLSNKRKKERKNTHTHTHTHRQTQTQMTADDLWRRLSFSLGSGGSSSFRKVCIVLGSNGKRMNESRAHARHCSAVMSRSIGRQSLVSSQQIQNHNSEASETV